MYERSTDHRELEKAKEIYPTAKTSDSQRVGTERQWDRGCPQVPDSSPYSVSLEESPGARGRDFPQWQTSAIRSQDKGTGRRESQIEGSPCHSDSGTDVVKKKDELGLTGRRKGATYSGIQRQRIIEEVERLKACGVSKTVALRSLGVCRSTYYGWLKAREISARKPSVLRLTEAEKQAVIEKKKKYPHLSHRQISGYLRHEGYWVSESSCYRILSALGWVFPQPLREAPWKAPHYEPFAPNQIWGEDWTRLVVAGLRHYLLTIIDYFSRYIPACRQAGWHGQL